MIAIPFISPHSILWQISLVYLVRLPHVLFEREAVLVLPAAHGAVRDALAASVHAVHVPGGDAVRGEPLATQETLAATAVQPDGAAVHGGQVVAPAAAASAVGRVRCGFIVPVVWKRSHGF